MAHLKLIAVLSLIFAATTGLAKEDYYVWVDENGVINYSERNPPGYNARLVTNARDLEELRESADARRPGRRPANQVDDDNREEPTPARNSIVQPPEGDEEPDPDGFAREERARIEREIAAVKEKNCEVGKRNLAQLQAYARIRMVDDNGEQRMLGDEEKQEKIEQARQIIRENCSG